MYIMTTIECLTLHLTVLVSGNCGSLYALFSICCSFLNDKNDFICIYAQPYCRVYLSTMNKSINTQYKTQSFDTPLTNGWLLGVCGRLLYQTQIAGDSCISFWQWVVLVLSRLAVKQINSRLFVMEWFSWQCQLHSLFVSDVTVMTSL